jgi:tetratricopeptide (TPR) repeat protein
MPMNRKRGRAAAALAAATAALGLLQAPPALANRASDALRARGSAEIYNLDRDRAIATFREAIAADPEDAAAYRGLATGLWLSITFTRGNMTIDDYLGGVKRQATAAAPAPPDIAAAFREAIGRALALAGKRAADHPGDADAHYQVAAALGLRASYIATVEGSPGRAFGMARDAYKEDEKVLEIDPSRKDAGLIVGTYRYIVSTLALPVRWLAYMAGIGGDRARGIGMIEEAAAYTGENQDDARFALVLVYNREKNYDRALQVLQTLRDKYPKNRLSWLETGSTDLRAGRFAEADRVLSDGLARFASDDRPRMFGEDALWHYKRGAARAALGRTGDADADLNAALRLEARKWVHGRSHLELGKLALKAGQSAAARQHFQAAVSLCDSDNDPGPSAEARRLMK